MSIINAFLASGGGGLEYETGTFTPASDQVELSVNFSKTHTTPPIAVLCLNVSNAKMPSGSNGIVLWDFIDSERIFGTAYYSGTGAYKTYFAQFTSTSSSSSDFQGATQTYGTSDTSQTGTSAARHYIREGSATLRTNGGYFRANVKYAWVAIWIPDSWVPPT